MTATYAEDALATHAGLGELVRDRALTSWRAGAMPQVPRDEILKRAARKLGDLNKLSQLQMGSRGQPSVAFVAAYGLLDLLILDDSATPQIAPTPDHGVEINWLVHGDWMHVDVDAAGAVVLEAGGAARGPLEIDAEFDAWSPDAFAIERGRTFLEKISADIHFRLR